MADLKKMMDAAGKVLEKTDLDEKLIKQAAEEVKKTKKVDGKIVDKIADAIDDLDGKKAKK